MEIPNTVKKVISFIFFGFSAVAFFSSSRAKKQYEALVKESRAQNEKISGLKREMNALSIKIERYMPKDCGSEEYQSLQEINDEEKIHMVKEYNGIVGVFDGNGVLIKEVDVTVSSLPDADRQDLKVGIRVYSSEELERLLDEFN